MNIRRTVKCEYCTVSEWEHPEELSRDWDEYFDFFINGNNWNKYIDKYNLTIDIGAHTGDTSLVLGYLSENVLAFEPNPDAFEILEFNANILNPTFNITPIPYAVTDKTGVFELYDHSGQNCNMALIPRGAAKLKVSGINLEEYLASRFISLDSPRFIKIDCEGYDIEIFNSIPNILDTKPVIFMEWHNDVDENYFFSSIESADYEALNPMTLKPVTEKVFDVLCVPR